MITSKQIQNKYKNLYVCLREYIWPAKVISDIANLEISVYKAFPNISEILNNFNIVKFDCHKIAKDDEELEKVLNDFEEILSDDVIYSKLDVRETGDIEK